MYRDHAGPPPPDPFAAARENARNCGYLQLGIAATNLVTLSTLSANLAGGRLARQFRIDPVAFSEFKTTALLVAIGFILVQTAWAALNYWGLGKRSKLAFVSSVLFALTSILSCFSAIFGAVLLALLFRREMKGWFDANVAPSP